MNDRLRVLAIQHLTVYRYRQPVRLGEHRMMFRPREGHDLRLLHSTLAILPRPTRLRWLHDVFDNSVAIATFDGEGTVELRCDSTVTLEHRETAPGAGWVDFDPTNRIVGNRNLIRVGVAWHPGQVLPLWGSFIGTGSAALGMDVTVTVTDA